MREFLFRGKRTDNGEWVYGDLEQIPSQKWCGISLQNSSKDVYTVDPNTVGQYTGLTDKNGKKIFEGDILLTDLSNPYSVVVFKNGCFMQKLEDSGEVFYDIFYPTENEDTSVYPYNIVCGNIYDNPELLK